GVQTDFFDSSKQFAYCWLARAVTSKHQGVYKEADECLGPGRVPVGNRRPHHHVLLPRVPSQQYLPGREQHHEESAVVRSTELLQSRGQLARESGLMDRAVES